MKRLLVLLVVGAVFAAPCVTDLFSSEPSPLAGLLSLTVWLG